jgi:hypothetical protein
MADTLFLLLVVAFFAISMLVVAACDRIAGTSPNATSDSEARDAN